MSSTFPSVDMGMDLLVKINLMEEVNNCWILLEFPQLFPLGHHDLKLSNEIGRRLFT